MPRNKPKEPSYKITWPKMKDRTVTTSEYGEVAFDSKGCFETKNKDIADYFDRFRIHGVIVEVSHGSATESQVSEEPKPEPVVQGTKAEPVPQTDVIVETGVKDPDEDAEVDFGDDDYETATKPTKSTKKKHR